MRGEYLLWAVRVPVGEEADRLFAKKLSLALSGPWPEVTNGRLWRSLPLYGRPVWLENYRS